MAPTARTPLPDSVTALLWDLDLAALDPTIDADAVLARVLEYGRLEDVRWLLAFYGETRVRTFFEGTPHPLVSERTRGFWHAYFRPERPWPSRSDFRTQSTAPWVG
ncbi:MAG: hypothetical protein FJ096_21580 [Deltaproteobacteria bacterium]|nr:hypothetical protein [Deltaproteobacteria bacterium]